MKVILISRHECISQESLDKLNQSGCVAIEVNDLSNFKISDTIIDSQLNADNPPYIAQPDGSIRQVSTLAVGETVELPKATYTVTPQPTIEQLIDMLPKDNMERLNIFFGKFDKIWIVECTMICFKAIPIARTKYRFEGKTPLEAMQKLVETVNRGVK